MKKRASRVIGRMFGLSLLATALGAQALELQ